MNQLNSGLASEAGQAADAPVIELEATLASKISFATHQNDVPVLRDLQIVNGGSLPLEGLRLKIEANPAVITPKQWFLDRIAPGAAVRPADRDLTLNGNLLMELNEAVRANITMRVCDGTEKVLLEREFPVELLARNEWGGSAAMPELLASFVQPNDPTVSAILKTASTILARAGKSDRIEGYQSKSRSRVYELASAIWSAAVGLRLSYAEPPASFESEGQKIRTPSQILEAGLATCLDTAVLFAACLEQAGLYPILVITKGHAFAGVWLQPQEFASLLIEDAGALRKRIALDELVVFETTMATSRTHPSFSQTIAEGARKIAENSESDFIFALDLRRARMQKLRPLALAQNESGGGSDDEPAQPSDPAGEALEDAPILPDFDLSDPEIPSVTPDGRLERWQRKLLDLTVRNRLLNVKPGPSAIRLICIDPAGMEDRLAGGDVFKIVSAPQLETRAGRDADIHLARTGEQLNEEYAQQALERRELLSPLDQEQLETRLIELYRKARLDFAEGGANTLFLALGFLNWRKSESDGRKYRAPLILLPVKLDRRSVRSGVRLSHHEDEPRFNLTLLQMLRQDFDLDIPELAADELPPDESGVDVPRVWNLVRRAVRDIPGFEVNEEVMLGTFSFAKYLMWKDLVDRTEALKANPVVRHLLETPRQPYANGSELPRTETLDEEFAPSDLFAPLPADSSQLTAVVGSARKCDFVLDGPPGTGKSQTIANMIAHNLALGRKVLFVAEKRAALEVVYRRLVENGLGPFCLELHSNKANKQDVLSQLDNAWSATGALSSDKWAKTASELKARRDELNTYVRALNERRSNGMTLHAAIGRVVRDGVQYDLNFDWSSSVRHDEASMASLRDVVRRLALTWTVNAPHAFSYIGRTEWSNQWQRQIAEAAASLTHALQDLENAHHQLCERIGVNLPSSSAALSALAELSTGFTKSHGLDLSFAFAPDAAKVLDSVSAGLREVEAYRNSARSLSAEYSPEYLRKLDIPKFVQEWQAACKSIWPISFFKRHTVEKSLRPAGATKVDPELDLPVIMQMRERLDRVDQLAGDAFRVPHWTGIATDLPGALNALQVAETLRAACGKIASTPKQAAELKTALTALYGHANEMLAADAPVGQAARGYVASHKVFRASLGKFEALANCSVWPAEDGVFLNALKAVCESVCANTTRLNEWCAWQRARMAANDLGLKTLADALEQGRVSSETTEDAFETAYARWFASCLIDADPVLRDFNRNEQENAIERFRELDDEFAQLTRDYVRARILQEIPSKDQRQQPPGFGALAHQIKLQRRHKPVRQLVAEMGPALTTLAPCLLMSPLSVAQYLPPDAALFDLVIFDEASQITPWDAVGSIARGRQVVVAGDPKQMPPTSFFDRSADRDSDDSEIEEDMESILDECLGAQLPRKRLTWHYRSRHESLICFSNHRYYDGDLITFPAPVTRESAVSLVPVAGAWSRGKSRTNQVEAEAIVADVVRRLSDSGFQDEKGRPLSLGVITLNSEQQKLIEDLLDRERQRKPSLETFFAESAAEPVIVKNLETVQGDERDVILLGIGFGPETPGAPIMPMNFGPLNRSGGWRRLNVAITRARREMLVYASFPPYLIDLNRTGAEAVRDLKHYLEFAERGPRALGDAVAGSVGGYESPFEQAVARGLRERGWTVVPQIGVSRFRIDLGIVHPDRPGDFLVGVECDGASYHSAATARDRDKVREGVLRNLGWSLLRVWSTDWWVDTSRALDRLDKALKDKLEQSRAMAAVTEPTAQKETDVLYERARPEARLASADLQPPRTDNLEHTCKVSKPAALFRATSFDDLTETLSPEQFYDESYIPVLRDMVRRVVQLEAPIRDLLLVERIARAHGFQRSGHLIRERVLSIARQEALFQAEKTGSVFIWAEATAPRDWKCARAPSGDDDIRAIEDIALEELAAALAQYSKAEASEVEAARFFGIRRLSFTARARLELAHEYVDLQL